MYSLIQIPDSQHLTIGAKNESSDPGLGSRDIR
jgi:hypothetical protein